MSGDELACRSGVSCGEEGLGEDEADRAARSGDRQSQNQEQVRRIRVATRRRPEPSLRVAGERRAAPGASSQLIEERWIPDDRVETAGGCEEVPVHEAP